MVAALALTLFAGITRAAVTPEAQCQSGKSKEAATYAACRLKVKATLVRTRGTCSATTSTVCYRDVECPGDETCNKDLTKYDKSIAKCKLNCSKRWAALEEKALRAGASCPSTGDDMNIQDILTTCTDQVAAQIAGIPAPVCGDGKVEGPETCDDGNALACGSCNDDCTRSQVAAATGSITAVGRSSLVDGETFTLNDGVNPQTTFEFDFGNGVGASRVAIVAGSTDTASKVASNITNAINGVGAGLAITASVTSTVVTLTNHSPGSMGNQAISETVSNAGFVVAGMSGGGGYDCPSGTGCVSEADCAAPLTCQGTGVKTCH